MKRGENVRDCNVKGGMDELGARAVNAININPIGSGSKAAGKWVEMKESGRERGFEAMEKSNHKEISMVEGRLRGFVKEKAFLIVVDGKQEELRRAQVEGLV